MKRLLSTSLLGLTSLTMGACFHSDDNMENGHSHEAMYEVSIVNLSNHQVLTPPAVIIHDNTYKPWQLGHASSVALEKLAEGGDTTDFVAEAMMHNGVYTTKVISAAPIAPGASSKATLSTEHGASLSLSLASMLANTNDAFTGINSADIATLAQGESIEMLAHVYDAGTEANTEAMGTIPGPADGGTGFDAMRDDLIDAIVVHAGVVSKDDGLSTSVLDESHRWNGPVARIVITRI
ncbi:MAG: spondin domain-containing protein [Gammaproteobacteria bacterium]|nr:spondin domain-containing protein [Gammaproteobacteria bacterium]